ncbi:hypothetical protein ROG8370_03339 [Roseovarius gaetbuli]|uniref:Uncharacterized protein n=1 Tax=Roseovarius gaetbuli TaxID=1356575 RepID=A0A1X7A458_9RHOB|nr:hypothetical protein ROG8370_03339 [Roseovarius gaetbuli]
MHPGPASYDHTGRRFVFVPAAGDTGHYALDVERRDVALDVQTVSMLAKIAPDITPLQAWTQIEVLAKLLDTPAHLILRLGLRCDPRIEIGTPPSASHWISIGRIRDAADG